VVRTSLILGDGRGGHDTLTKELLSGRAQGVLFTDQIRKPVHVDDLGLRLPVDVRLRTGRATSLLRTRLRGPRVHGCPIRELKVR
jgi:hypothetical protein